MRITYLLLSLVLCLCPVMQAQNTTNQFMTQHKAAWKKKTTPKLVIFFYKLTRAYPKKVITNKRSMPVRRRLIYIIARIITKRHSIFAAR